MTEFTGHRKIIHPTGFKLSISGVVLRGCWEAIAVYTAGMVGRYLFSYHTTYYQRQRNGTNKVGCEDNGFDKKRWTDVLKEYTVTHSIDRIDKCFVLYERISDIPAWNRSVAWGEGPLRWNEAGSPSIACGGVFSICARCAANALTRRMENALAIFSKENNGIVRNDRSENERGS